MAPPADIPPPARVVLVVALLAEARPLIERFTLAPRHEEAPFRGFDHPEEPISLVISGTGRVAAGAAVAHTAARYPGCAWLNVGVAGHADRPLGELLLAHRVRDDATGRSWYPPLVFRPPCGTASVCTVAAPSSDYPGDKLYDMEAAGFCEVATRCATRELVHCLKVVSDTRAHPASQLDAARIAELIGANVGGIGRVIAELGALAAERQQLAADPPAYDALLRTARFSVTRRRQLRRLLRRWALLCGDTDPAAWIAAHPAAGDAGAILQALAAHVDAQPVRLRSGPLIGRRPAELGEDG